MRKIPNANKPDKPKKHVLLSIKPKESEYYPMWHGCDKVSKVFETGGGGS